MPRALLAWLLLATLAVVLGCAGKKSDQQPASSAQPMASVDEASWASDDSLAGIALQCSTNVHHNRPIPVNGRSTPDSCVHVPPGAHVCFGDIAVWTSHVDFDVTVDFGTSSPFDVSKFVVPKGGEIRLAVTHHGPTAPTQYHYGTTPDFCTPYVPTGKVYTPPEVIVDN